MGIIFSGYVSICRYFLGMADIPYISFFYKHQMLWPSLCSRQNSEYPLLTTPTPTRATLILASESLNVFYLLIFVSEFDQFT